MGEQSRWIHSPGNLRSHRDSSSKSPHQAGNRPSQSLTACPIFKQAGPSPNSEGPAGQSDPSLEPPSQIFFSRFPSTTFSRLNTSKSFNYIPTPSGSFVFLHQMCSVSKCDAQNECNASPAVCWECLKPGRQTISTDWPNQH